jgi:hypothetical protein
MVGKTAEDREIMDKTNMKKKKTSCNGHFSRVSFYIVYAKTRTMMSGRQSMKAT